MQKTIQVAETLALAAILLFGSVGIAAAGGAECAKNKAAADDSEQVYAVEGEVQKPLRKSGPAPSYPEVAREEKIQGTVVARLLIEKNGSVSSAHVVQPLRDDFDAHTLEAVSQWTFEPATLAGDPVRVEYDITVNYRLDDAGDSKSGDA